MATADSPQEPPPERPFLLPGDVVDHAYIPNASKRLRIGPGLRLVPPATLQCTVAGQLFADRRKNMLQIEGFNGKYAPVVHDQVLGTVIRSQGEHYLVSLASVPGSADAPSTVALLPHMAFEHVTRKTRPQLGPGSLVYARVESVGFGSGGGGSGGAAATSSSIQGVLSDNVELTCLADPAAAGPGRGKKAASEGLGPLTGGTVVPVSLGLARRLMLRRPEEEGKVVVLEELASPGAAGKGSGATAAGLSFEMAVGRNGRVWVNSDDVRTVVIVCRALRELDERRLNVEEQRKLARRLLRGQ